MENFTENFDFDFVWITVVIVMNLGWSSGSRKNVQTSADFF